MSIKKWATILVWLFCAILIAETVQDIQTIDGAQRQRLAEIIGTGTGIGGIPDPVGLSSNNVFTGQNTFDNNVLINSNLTVLGTITSLDITNSTLIVTNKINMIAGPKAANINLNESTGTLTITNSGTFAFDGGNTTSVLLTNIGTTAQFHGPASDSGSTYFPYFNFYRTNSGTYHGSLGWRANSGFGLFMTSDKTFSILSDSINWMYSATNMTLNGDANGHLYLGRNSGDTTAMKFVKIGGKATPVYADGTMITTNSIFFGADFATPIEGNWKVEMQYGATTNLLIMRYDGTAYATNTMYSPNAMLRGNLHHGADFISNVVTGARLLIQ